MVGEVRVRVQFLHTAIGKTFAPISRWYSHYVKMTKEVKIYKQKKGMLLFLTLAFVVSLMSIVMRLSNNLQSYLPSEERVQTAASKVVSAIRPLSITIRAMGLIVLHDKATSIAAFPRTLVLSAHFFGILMIAMDIKISHCGGEHWGSKCLVLC